MFVLLIIQSSVFSVRGCVRVEDVPLLWGMCRKSDRDLAGESMHPLTMQWEAQREMEKSILHADVNYDDAEELSLHKLKAMFYLMG